MLHLCERRIIANFCHCRVTRFTKCCFEHEIIEVAASSSFSGSGAMVSSSSSCSAMACEFTSKSGKSGAQVALKYLRISQNYRIANLKKCEQLLCGLLRDVPILSRNHHINAQLCPATGVVLPQLVQRGLQRLASNQT